MDALHDPQIRVMALHALEYCERLFYLEEVEEIRLADADVFAGRSLHLDLALENALEKSEVDLSCETLGLVGRADIIKKSNGEWIPFEHKKGASRAVDNAHHAWPPDSLQVVAYAMLLETKFGLPVSEGRIRYHRDNVTVRVAVDFDARQRVLAAAARARLLRSSPNRPPVADNDRLCLHCSLSPVCLPEEDRIARNKNWSPIRLFPPDREGRAIHVTSHSAVIRRSNDQLTVQVKDADDLHFSSNEIDSLILHGYPQITTQALHHCAYNGIPVHWISAGGRYVAGLLAGAGSVQRRLRQFKALSSPAICIDLSRRTARAKAESQLRYMLRATAPHQDRPRPCVLAANLIRACVKDMSNAASLDEIRGCEGAAARAYFDIFPELIKNRAPAEMLPDGRTRRPPQDRFNALLSFGYSLLYQSTLTAIVAVGLDPAVGYFHTPRSSAYPLVMDLMDLFRVALWDIPLLGSVNRLQWDPAADFNVTNAKVWLSASGRKKAIALYESRLEEKWKHPILDYSLSYYRTIELEVRLLEKEWAGEPGLFARGRLR
ncbi:MAG TPA: type I-MYXAN CRISPR-associated endonuclease Cas1 [bacterium]|nr:type I-MYXAN CRISPR-associated endonuclease Cas1 [bacterium]